MNTALDKIRASLATKKQRASYPDWNLSDVVAEKKLAHGSLLDSFVVNLAAVSGLAMHSVEEVSRFLSEGRHSHGYCAPELAEGIGKKLGSDISFSSVYDEARIDDYAFGVTRATAAIAESGTLVLRDGETSCRLGALTPWIHIAVVEQSSIVRTIGDAIAVLGDDPNVIWVTGPSKTADVEGILIEGVHGPGVQIALIV